MLPGANIASPYNLMYSFEFLQIGNCSALNRYFVHPWST